MTEDEADTECRELCRAIRPRRIALLPDPAPGFIVLDIELVGVDFLRPIKSVDVFACCGRIAPMQSNGESGLV